MPAPIRPRRSVLYMPGSNARALDKARSLPADGLILDLEDAVAPDAKADARDKVCEAASTGGYAPREVLIRTNGLNTPWGYADLVAAAKAGADGVLIPKVESADVVRQAVTILEMAGAPDELKLWCMMETPRGMLRAEEIASASSRLGGLVVGTSDLAKEIQAAHTPQRLPMITSLSLCVLAARAFGLAVLDGVYLDLNDEDGFKNACYQGVELGFDGKTLIHPKQIAPANLAFAPNTDEVDQARRVIEAFEEATREGKGVVVVDGRLIESLHVAEARHIVRLAEMIEKMPAA